MGTTSRSRKPNEWAAKINHTHIINDPYIKQFLQNCSFPDTVADIADLDIECLASLDTDGKSTLQHILAVDGSYTVAEVKKDLPSSQIAFLQFGAISFDIKDLEKLSAKNFIFPEDIHKLHHLQRFKFGIPIQNITYSAESSLKNSIRKVVYDFFMEQRDGSSFMETLAWFVFSEYSGKSQDSYNLASNPNREVGTGSCELVRNTMNKSDYTFATEYGKVYLTDVFRLHEVVDEDHGAAGILGYITRLIEQLILVHFIRIIYCEPSLFLKDFLFIIDGPLSFAGQTAGMNRPMRSLCNHLRPELFLAGIEKSGPFVEHALKISLPPKGSPILPVGKYILLSNNYIYQYVIPGDSAKMHYGVSSYYGAKIIFHSEDDQVLVISVPVPDKNVVMNPKKTDYANLDDILRNVQKLKYAMYDDSIIPIALANKLVSLANHPSSALLEKFARSGLGAPVRQKNH